MRFDDGSHRSSTREAGHSGSLEHSAPRTSSPSGRTSVRRFLSAARRTVAVGAGLIAVGLMGPVVASELEHPSLATLAPPSGWALWRNNRPVPSQPSPLGSVLEVTDVLEAGSRTWIGVLFPPSLLTYLGPGSKMTVQDLRLEADGMFFTTLKIAGEAFRAVIDPLLGLQTVRVEAGNVTAVTQEADLLVIETPEGARELRVFDGRLEAFGPDGRRVSIGAGQWVLAQPDGRLGPVLEMGTERDQLDRRYRPPEGTQVSVVPTQPPAGLPRPADAPPQVPDLPIGGWDSGADGGEVGGEAGTGAPPLPPIAGESTLEVAR